MTVRREFIGQVQAPGKRSEDVRLYGNFREPEWFTRVKTADQEKASDTTLANDDELYVTVEVNAVYVVKFELFYQTTSTADFQFSITGPASPSSVGIRGFAGGRNTTSTAFIDLDFGETNTVSGAASGNGGHVEAVIFVKNGSNLGNINIQWAQNTSDAIATILYAGSYISWMRVGGVSG